MSICLGTWQAITSIGCRGLTLTDTWRLRRGTPDQERDDTDRIPIPSWFHWFAFRTWYPRPMRTKSSKTPKASLMKPILQPPAATQLQQGFDISSLKQRKLRIRNLARFILLYLTSIFYTYFYTYSMSMYCMMRQHEMSRIFPFRLRWHVKDNSVQYPWYWDSRAQAGRFRLGCR